MVAQNQPGRSFCFTADNLNVHQDKHIHGMIESRGHKHLFNAPYWAIDGPMEYVFNSVHLHLLMNYGELNDLDELENVTDTIIANLGHWMRYFLHCKFPNT